MDSKPYDYWNNCSVAEMVYRHPRVFTRLPEGAKQLLSNGTFRVCVLNGTISKSKVEYFDSAHRFLSNRKHNQLDVAFRAGSNTRLEKDASRRCLIHRDVLYHGQVCPSPFFCSHGQPQLTAEQASMFRRVYREMFHVCDALDSSSSPSSPSSSSSSSSVKADDRDVEYYFQVLSYYRYIANPSWMGRGLIPDEEVPEGRVCLSEYLRIRNQGREHDDSIVDIENEHADGGGVSIDAAFLREHDLLGTADDGEGSDDAVETEEEASSGEEDEVYEEEDPSRGNNGEKEEEKCGKGTEEEENGEADNDGEQGHKHVGAVDECGADSCEVIINNDADENGDYNDDFEYDERCDPVDPARQPTLGAPLKKTNPTVGPEVAELRRLVWLYGIDGLKAAAEMVMTSSQTCAQRSWRALTKQSYDTKKKKVKGVGTSFTACSLSSPSSWISRTQWHRGVRGLAAMREAKAMRAGSSREDEEAAARRMKEKEGRGAAKRRAAAILVSCC